MELFPLPLLVFVEPLFPVELLVDVSVEFPELVELSPDEPLAEFDPLLFGNSVAEPLAEQPEKIPTEQRATIAKPVATRC